ADRERRRGDQRTAGESKRPGSRSVDLSAQDRYCGGRADVRRETSNDGELGELLPGAREDQRHRDPRLRHDRDGSRMELWMDLRKRRRQCASLREGVEVSRPREDRVVDRTEDRKARSDGEYEATNGTDDLARSMSERRVRRAYDGDRADRDQLDECVDAR